MKHENAKVIKLNDTFRQSLVGGALVVTHGIAALAAEDLAAIIAKVRSFDAFTEDNDPHGEHDFGEIEHSGEKIFWKIDCYDRQVEYHSDPEDPEAHRVLTIMLASEY